MKCPECKGEVPSLQFYCPHCRAEMPATATEGVTAAAQRATRAEQREQAERAALLRRRAPRMHSRKLYEIGWQAMQWIVVLGVFGGAFAAYQRINWQNAAQRMNEATNNAVRSVEDTETPGKSSRRNARAKARKK